jgi:hypothetical protein
VTLLVLVVLAIVWVAVLVPPMVRARAETRPAESISAFHRQLTVLRRTAPFPRRVGLHDRPRSHGALGVPAPMPLVNRSTVNRSTGNRSTVNRSTSVRALRAPSAAAPSRSRSARSVSTRTLRRRRDVFVALLAAAALSLLLGVLVMRAMLAVHIAVDVLLGAYVGLLIRQRNLAAEREMKVRFLPGPRAVEPALLRRSVN